MSPLKCFPNGSRVFQIQELEDGDPTEEGTATVLGYDITRETYHVWIDGDRSNAGHDYWPCREVKLAVSQPWNEPGNHWLEPGEWWVLNQHTHEDLRGAIVRVADSSNPDGMVEILVKRCVDRSAFDYPVSGE